MVSSMKSTYQRLQSRKKQLKDYTHFVSDLLLDQTSTGQKQCSYIHFGGHYTPQNLVISIPEITHVSDLELLPLHKSPERNSTLSCVMVGLCECEKEIK